MAMSLGGGGGYNAEINVTPLVDVVLVLLIIFMVITPLSQLGYDVEVPKENPSLLPPDPSQKQVILAINSQSCPGITDPLGGRPLPAGCAVFLNKEPVSIADLPRRVGEIFGTRRDKILFLAAEERLNYEGVMMVVDAAKAGNENMQIGIVTDPALAEASSATASNM